MEVSGGSPTTQEHYAGFWVRFFAALLDMAFYTPLYLGIIYAFGPAHYWLGEGVFAVIALLTYAWFFASKWQGSPGMYLLRFHICNTEGARIGFRQSLLWGITGTIGWLICFTGVLYLQSKFDIYAVRDLMQSCQDANLSPDDCAKEIESVINVPFASFMGLCYAALALTSFLTLIWALSIALPKDKTGFHNIICKTRFIQGRP